MSEPEFPWHLGVYDAHCHPTDTMSSIESISTMKTKVLTVMATRAQDQELVANAASAIGLQSPSTAGSEDQKMIPSFGWHPWFSHQMYEDEAYGGASTLDDEAKISHYQAVLTPKSEDRNFLASLPDPKPFSRFLTQTEQHLVSHPFALVGEIGLDKSFRIPDAWLPEQHAERDDDLTPGGREGRRLSPFRVDLEHQRKILRAQLMLAGKLHRAVSVHGVQAHGQLYHTISALWQGYEKNIPGKRKRRKAAKSNQAPELEDAGPAGEKPYPPRICLHSYSGSPEQLKQYFSPSVPAEVYVSFSECINFSSSGASKAEASIGVVPDDRLLVESDLHTAGNLMDEALEAIVRRICTVRNWSLNAGTQQLGQNWKRFVFGAEDCEKIT